MNDLETVFPNSSDASEQDFQVSLTWDDAYAIAMALRRTHAGIPLDKISFSDIYHWTVALPAFCDDPELVNEAILTAIFQEWFEEVNPL
jgi:FeS assembly protein IscX